MDLLGDAMFTKVLHEFIDRWHGKHTLPWDMFNTFNNASGKDNNWFFNNWYFSNGYIDVAVAGHCKSADERQRQRRRALRAGKILVGQVQRVGGRE